MDSVANKRRSGGAPVQHRTCKCGEDCQDIVCSRCFRLRAHWLNWPQGDFCQACLLLLLSGTDTPGVFKSSLTERRILWACCMGQRWVSRSDGCTNTKAQRRRRRRRGDAAAAQRKLYMAQLELSLKMHLLCCSSHTTLQSSWGFFCVSLKCSFSDWGVHTGVLFKHRVLQRRSVCCKATKCLGGGEKSRNMCIFSGKSVCFWCWSDSPPE